MIKYLQDTVKLNNGIDMPGFGLGVFQVEDGNEVIRAVNTAIHTGYRLIDTASYYQNEQGVGEGIRQSGIKREEIFVTTKIWNEEQGYDETLRAFEKSLNRLKFDYLDLYLIHWPVAGLYKETWKAMERLYQEGVVRAIGVSNFHTHHLKNLFTDANIKPTINQIEYHPHLTQVEIKRFCEQNAICMQAWSPIKQGQLLNNETLIPIAKKYGKTTPQVILRWDIQNRVMTIPKSITPTRIQENSQIFDFELTEEEMKTIDGMNMNERTGPNPDEF